LKISVGDLVQSVYGPNTLGVVIEVKGAIFGGEEELIRVLWNKKQSENLLKSSVRRVNS
tara:strand:- start:1864 stop:2040 length:177 start_codon:yes stop_codon:yes gene_type:complete